MWIRATLVYRTSFLINTLGNFLANALDFIAILLMFSHIDALGGFGLPEIALLYGAACSSFGLADLLLGNADRIGQRVRDGSFDILLLRPVPVLAQAAADRFALRRLGRITQGALVLGWGISRVDINWTLGKALFTAMMVISGSAIFGAVFIAGAAFQFWAAEASEVSNSFTFGGCTLLQYPPTVFARELVRGVTFIVPLAFVNWLPALHLLGRADPLHLPGWVAYCGPLVALLTLTAAGLLWRAGLRSYRSTGS
ncbi:ABC transporter permease [Streptomyces sp. NPDC052396]|uniref:ABC transporter permease n=1 Tax=Streptomyces sp. NPDC052396 TaxID=3365689 RepID=UPI0037D7C6AC